MANPTSDSRAELPDSIRKRVHAVAVRVQVAREGRKTGITLLFVGGERSGRAAAMAALVDELDVKIYRVHLDRVVRESIGETEKNLNKVFSAGERSGVILFFDEADALFGKRTDVKDSHDRYANLEAAFARTLRAHSVVVLLATGRPGQLSNEIAACVDHEVELANPAADTD